MSARRIFPLAAVLAALGGGVALAAKDETLLVSERGGVAANGNSRSVSVSADGGRVAFTSAADNLSDDDQTTDDIFLRDMLTGGVALVSRRSDNLLGPPGADGPSARAGANSAFFNGRVAGRALRPARYRATLQSADAAGNRSAARRVAFRIVRR